MTDTEIDRAIDDVRQANKELFIRDETGGVFKNLTSFPDTEEENSFEISDLDQASNMSSSTQLEADTKYEETKIVCGSKRLTKTILIVRYNNPICHDYRKHRRKAELGSNKVRDIQPQLTQTADNNQTSRTYIHRDNHTMEDRLSVHKAMDIWRNYRHTEASQNPIGQTAANSEGRCSGSFAQNSLDKG